MQLKFSLFWILAIIGIQTFGQQPVKLIGGKSLYNDIYQAAYKNIDELQKSNENGILLIKIELLDRKTKNITFSSEHPIQLISMLQGVIQNNILKTNSRSLKTVIIPVSYNYKTTLTINASDLLNQVPSVAVDKIPAPISQNDYDSFLGIKSTSNEVFGVSCILLPSIKLNGKTE